VLDAVSSVPMGQVRLLPARRGPWWLIAPRGVFIAFGCLLVSASASSHDEFEVVPEQTPTQLLPAALAEGPNFHVVDPVQGDGLMYRFVVDSRFGKFEAYGRLALQKRVGEVAALTELSTKSDAGLVAAGVAQGVESQVKTAVGVVKNPIGTVTGIPKGVAHLFQGYTAQAQEATSSIKSAANEPGVIGKSSGDDLKKGEQAAQHYAERYLGVSSAERGWYRRLAVDPYTDNTVLRAAIHKAAKKEAVGSFGIKFAGLPAIPGIAVTQRALDAIYNEDPATVRQRMRKTLAGYGLSAAETEAWLNAPLLSPTRQVLLLSAVAELGNVAGRAELFRHSLDLSSDAEAQVYLRSVGLLTLAHKSHPLRAIIPGVRLPAAQLADAGLVVCGAFEAVYWTQDVAANEEQLERSLPPQQPGKGRELWLEGSVSDVARGALRDRGWNLHLIADSAPGEAVASH
jgi:hypothetical protein